MATMNKWFVLEERLQVLLLLFRLASLLLKALCAAAHQKFTY